MRFMNPRRVNLASAMNLCLPSLGAMLLTLAVASAQPPSRPPRGDRPGRADGAEASVDSFVARMMTFDANQDGQISKSEMTDARLTSLFERADADSSGVVTKEELTALFAKETAAIGSRQRGGPERGPGGGPRGDGPPGFGPPGDGSPGNGPPGNGSSGDRTPSAGPWNSGRRPDRGPPIAEIAKELGVTPEKLREAFAKARPAPPGERPSDEQRRENRKILADALGVSPEKLDEVLDKYRPGARGENGPPRRPQD